MSQWLLQRGRRDGGLEQGLRLKKKPPAEGGSRAPGRGGGGAVGTGVACREQEQHGWLGERGRSGEVRDLRAQDGVWVFSQGPGCQGGSELGKAWYFMTTW